MKKIIFGLLFASASVTSCSEENNNSEKDIDSKEIIELEQKTNEVSDGTKKMEQKVDELSSDVDELLNDI
jgi:peptidoglycan hydrolase CwlO-like protein